MDTEASRGTPGVGVWRAPYRHGAAVLVMARAEQEEPLPTPEPPVRRIWPVAPACGALPSRQPAVRMGLVERIWRTLRRR